MFDMFISQLILVRWVVGSIVIFQSFFCYWGWC